MKKTNTKTATATTVGQIRAIIAVLRKEFPFEMTLNNLQRDQLRALKLGPKKLQLIQSYAILARQQADKFPPTFNLKKFEQDAEHVAALAELLESINRARERVNDTLLAVGLPVYNDALTAKGYVEVAASTTERSQKTIATTGSRSHRSTRTSLKPPLPPPGADSVPVPSEPVVEPQPANNPPPVPTEEAA